MELCIFLGIQKNLNMYLVCDILHVLFKNVIIEAINYKVRNFFQI